MILLVDNYDSFVFNLARYFERLGQTTLVVRNDKINAAEVLALRPQAIVLSPGPCTPNEAGCSLDVVRKLHDKLPILGVCLGHQTIAAALGGNVIPANEPVHGRSWTIHHGGEGIFAGMPSPIIGCRYHSLAIERESLPPELRVTAWTDDGTIMAIEHQTFPVVGIQFHPESILTDSGYPLLAAFLRRAEIALPTDLPTIASERVESQVFEFLAPATPVTF